MHRREARTARIIGAHSPNSMCNQQMHLAMHTHTHTRTASEGKAEAAGKYLSCACMMSAQERAGGSSEVGVGRR